MIGLLAKKNERMRSLLQDVPVKDCRSTFPVKQAEGILISLLNSYLELIWKGTVVAWFELLFQTLCKIRGFPGDDYKECRLLGYKTPVRTSQETHYVSATEPSQLMLCKIWGFHDDDYEECRLLGYKTPVQTSQETHYVSVTEPSQLMLCKIWGFHDDDYEECRLLGYKTPVQTSQETHYVSVTEPS
jgi:hypothetical protein